RVSGEIGVGRRAAAHELEAAMGARTAGVIFLVSPFTSPPGLLPFEEVVRIAHARGVPVLVDAASMVPPRDHLFRYIRGGADLVVYSGGKGIRGPQSTGILVGRADLIRAAALNASPNQAIGPAAKTSKEEIVGLVTALELCLAEDEAAEMAQFRDTCARVVEEVRDIPGLRAEGDPHIYVQQGAYQGGYGDEIAVDPINLQPGEEKVLAARLREELTRPL